MFFCFSFFFFLDCMDFDTKVRLLWGKKRYLEVCGSLKGWSNGVGGGEGLVRLLRDHWEGIGKCVGSSLKVFVGEGYS